MCDLTDALQDRFLHNICIGAKRDVLALSTDRPLAVVVGRSREAMRFRVHFWRAGELREFDLPETAQVYYFVQALGEDYLCVAGRCAPDEKNAHVFAGRDGEAPLRSWHAGDGIEDVQVAPNKQIWVSYFDEGVFGGTPMESNGLVCFGAEGELIFEFRKDCPALPAACEGMADCYALNVVSNRDTWLFYYTEFPLVHLRDLRFKEFFAPPREMVGSHAFAVCDTRRLFVGGYQFRGRLFWRDEANKSQVEIEVEDENGAAVNLARARTKVHGRGADLFLIDEAKVRVLSLQDIRF